MKCRKCGEELGALDASCSRCGEPRELGQETGRTMALPPVDLTEGGGGFSAVSHHEPSLVISKGSVAGQGFDLTKPEITLGRDPGNDIFLDDVTVSRRHAKIVMEGEAFSIEDVGSLNGTYVNNQRVDKCVLSEGDELQIGKYKLFFMPAKR